MSVHPGTDGAVADLLLRSGRFFTRSDVSDDLRTVTKTGGREGDVFYRDRWSHDKVVRSTHGVNCTGSCSWKVYVKDGIITWETQETDYPTVGPDRPDYEPRGCPRGAAFSWYTYSPTRVRYPYARGVLIEMYREARARLGDPVLAWAEIQDDPERRRRYHRARGKGGLIRIGWDEAAEIAAAAHVHTIARYGPDRIAGFSPIPAMSMVSHAAGSRFIELMGGAMTSFYDWYADLPVASPQVFGDQTDVPESGDWWDASYLMMWGSNVPVTRTPDAHWMAEVRYRGTKVVVGQPRLLGQHQVRRRVDALRAGHRRRDGDGDGARHPVRIPGRQADTRSSSTTSRNTPTCRSWSVSRNATAPTCTGKNLTAADLGDDRRGRGVQTGADRRPHRRGRGPERVPRLPVHRLRGRQVEPRPRRHRPAIDGARRRCRRTVRDGNAEARPVRHPGRARRGADPRRAGPPGRRTPVLHGVRPDAGPVRGAPRRAARRLADRLGRPVGAVHPGLAGVDHRGERVPGRSGWRRSSRTTPRNPAAGR